MSLASLDAIDLPWKIYFRRVGVNRRCASDLRIAALGKSAWQRLLLSRFAETADLFKIARGNAGSLSG
jgi:hypothetical protein